MPDEDRRKNDEAFRLKVVEQQGEIKQLIHQQIAEVKTLAEKIQDHGIKIVNIESALWGYPKTEDGGLLEKSRNQNRKWLILFSIMNVLWWGLIGLIKPIYTKWVTDYVYNSPSSRWMAEQRRPKVRHITVKIVRPREEPEPPPPDALP